jgi:glyoxalase family protein
MDEAADKIGTEYRQPPPEMVVNNRDEARIKAETWPEPVETISADMALMNGMHHITAIGTDIQRTHAFFGDLLGMRLVKRTSNFDDPNSAHWYWGVDDGKPGTLITYFERDPRKERPVQMGAGQTHHYAFAVKDEAEQSEWRIKLSRAGYRVSPIMDRVYFKSIYTHDPDGHIVELATVGPGFPFDESVADLGRSLKLPPWLEKERETIARGLKPLVVSDWTPPAEAAK